MTNIVPLNSTKHLNTEIKESKNFSRFKTQSLIPVVVQEFAVLATEFPIVFVKNDKNGQFAPIAMMGIKNNVNLYCQTKNWQSAVTPIGFRNAPLSLMKASSNSEEAIVFIDEESDLVSSSNGNKLFDASGEQSEYLKKRSNDLMNLANFTQQTEAITAYFANLKLLAPKQLSVKLNDNNPQVNIDGVFIIDEEALNKLSIDEFLAIKNKGLLPLIYAHLTSLHQIGRLIIKQNELDNIQA